MTHDRYLTDEAKAEHLTYWHERVNEGRFTKPGEGGHGYPDQEMVKWCEKLNAIEGVCTTQSCAGHWCAQDHIMNGELWLHLSEMMTERYRLRVFELWHRSYLIERVQTIYGDWGAEIQSIQFMGSGLGLLDESMTFILGFLSSLAEVE